MYASWVQIELVAGGGFTDKTMLSPNSLHMNSLYNTPTFYCLLLERAISLPVNKFLAATSSRVGQVMSKTLTCKRKGRINGLQANNRVLLDLGQDVLISKK